MSDSERPSNDAERSTTASGRALANAEPAATDSDMVATQLSNIHQTLELIALLLAVLLLSAGSIGAIAGGCAIVLLVGNAVLRAFE
ncbi:hypothetical protein [Halorussus litoreus]|uniref:hypothetical protein n=1 Tax=Halorussus litoreus TaxID=1710536 RepID=UPI000E22E40C|nr:hypothetical protein [Halorussus litoreus]